MFQTQLLQSSGTCKFGCLFGNTAITKHAKVTFVLIFRTLTAVYLCWLQTISNSRIIELLIMPCLQQPKQDHDNGLLPGYPLAEGKH